jgi:hypothetical protein
MAIIVPSLITQMSQSRKETRCITFKRSAPMIHVYGVIRTALTAVAGLVRPTPTAKTTHS